MSRLLAILVLLILPLQVSIAAAAEYCDLEKNDTGHHFGHHSHDGAQDKKDPASKKNADKNCAFCNLGCSQAPISFTVSVAAVVQDIPAFRDVPLPDGRPPTGFDRPPKHALA